MEVDVLNARRNELESRGRDFANISPLPPPPSALSLAFALLRYVPDAERCAAIQEAERLRELTEQEADILRLWLAPRCAVAA